MIDIIVALEEAVSIDRESHHTCNLGAVRIACHARHKNQKIQCDLYRFSCKCVFGLDHDPSVDGLGNFGDTSSDEMYAVISLGLDVEVFIFPYEIA